MTRLVHAGDLVGAVFGALFVVLNSQALGLVGHLVVSLLAVVAAVVVVVAWVRCRPLAGSEDGPSMRERAYWIVVVAEVAALAVGLVVFGLLAPQLSVPWLVLVVGVHFLAFARWWIVGARVFLLIGWVMTVLAVVGFVIGIVGGAGSADLAALVAGFLSGVLLLGVSTVPAVRALRAL